MKYPKNLPAGGTIGFVAPSFGCSIEPYRTGFLHAQENFKKMGYQVALGPNCYEQKGIGISNHPQACGEELTEYYASVDNDALISCGGGELMCESIEYVDFRALKSAEPKWYLGYSDNTNFTFLLNTMLDTAAIYGPCAASFGMDPWHESLQDTIDLLTGEKNSVKGYDLWEMESLKDEEHPLAPLNLTEKRNMMVYLPGDTEPHPALPGQEIALEGRLIGGCMDCLVNILGTIYDHVQGFTWKYQEDGILWFLEACDLNVMAIRRAVWQMKQAGWFNYIKGVLVGRPYHFGEDMMGLDQYHAVCDILAEYQVPILMDLDIGHRSPMMPLISGSYAKVSAKGNEIAIEFQKR